MASKRRKTRKSRRTRGLAASYHTSAEYARMEAASTAASQHRCATAISGYGEQRAMGEHSEAAHVFQDIMRFCVAPKDRR